MKITIIKQNPEGEEIWRYIGTILKRTAKFLVIEAFFDRDDMEFHGLSLCRGDRFVETYYFDRWYNQFEIFDRDDERFKGWYCNVSSPAIEENNRLIYRDLALDLLVFPDGEQIVLDEDEFKVLRLSRKEKKLALSALTELQTHFFEKFKAANNHLDEIKN